MLNGQSNLDITLHVLSLLFCNFINTAAYQGADTSLNLPLAVVLHGLGIQISMYISGFLLLLVFQWIIVKSKLALIWFELLSQLCRNQCDQIKEIVPERLEWYFKGNCGENWIKYPNCIWPCRQIQLFQIPSKFNWLYKQDFSTKFALLCHDQFFLNYFFSQIGVPPH